MGGMDVETLLQDIRYAARIFRRNPLFAFIIIFTLALAIGVNTAIFSLLNAVLLRPLPYPNADRLIMVWEDNSNFGFPRNHTSPPTYKDWKDRNQTFEQMAAVRNRTFNLTGSGDPDEVSAIATTANLFSVMGVQPVAGRVFREDEEQPGASRVAVLSHAFWQLRFGGDKHLIGQSIRLDDEPYVVVGVMPADFEFPDKGTRMWVPLALAPAEAARRTSHFLRVVGLLKPGVNFKQAHGDMEKIAGQLQKEYPEASAKAGVALVPLKEQLVGDARPAMWVLIVLAGSILLIACSNVANLMMARMAARKREFSLRQALGASKARLTRQLFTESVLFALISGGIGLLLAPLTFNLLKIFVPVGLTSQTGLALDPTALIFTLAVSLLAAILFGTVPALQHNNMNLNEDLKQSGGGKGVIGGKSRHLQKILVVAEVALALMLVIGAGLMIQTYLRLRNVNLGFNPVNVLTLRTAISQTKYPDPNQRLAIIQQLLERVETLPGVEAAGYTTVLPLGSKGVFRGINIEGRPAPTPGEVPLPLIRVVSPNYLKALGIPLLQGRHIDRTDGPSSHVAVINETMAKTFWAGENPLGRQFTLAGEKPPPPISIVGVVENEKATGIDADFRPIMYLSYTQFTQPNLLPSDLAIRTTGDPKQLAPVIRERIWAIDRDQPISRLRSLEEIVDAEVVQRRAYMWLLSIFAGLALIQAMLGIYGVLAYLVAQQTHMIGVLMALGATERYILRKVLGQGVGLAIIGVIVGVFAALGLTRFASTMLYGVSATDPATFLFTSLIILVVSAFACYLPARRATKVDPLSALRME